MYCLSQCLARPLATFGTVCRRSCLTAVLPMMSMVEYGRREVLMLLNAMARCEHGATRCGPPKGLAVSGEVSLWVSSLFWQFHV